MEVNVAVWFLPEVEDARVPFWRTRLCSKLPWTGVASKFVESRPLPVLRYAQRNAQREHLSTSKLVAFLFLVFINTFKNVPVGLNDSIQVLKICSKPLRLYQKNSSTPASNESASSLPHRISISTSARPSKIFLPNEGFSASGPFYLILRML